MALPQSEAKTKQSGDQTLENELRIVKCEECARIAEITQKLHKIIFTRHFDH